MSTIGDLSNRLREFFSKKHVQVGITVLLVSLLSFGLGYIFGRDFNQAPIVIEQTPK